MSRQHDETTLKQKKDVRRAVHDETKTKNNSFCLSNSFNKTLAILFR